MLNLTLNHCGDALHKQEVSAQAPTIHMMTADLSPDRISIMSVPPEAIDLLVFLNISTSILNTPNNYGSTTFQGRAFQR